METNADERRDLEVRGRVQGVGFRWSARKRAEELGLRGAVRNNPDGSVSVLAVGDPGAVERFVTWLRAGPPGARVEDVADAEAGALPLPEAGFHIVR